MSLFAQYRKITKMQFRAVMLYKSTGQKKYMKLFDSLEPTRKALHKDIMSL